jgi:hypothetical protein
MKNFFNGLVTFIESKKGWIWHLSFAMFFVFGFFISGTFLGKVVNSLGFLYSVFGLVGWHRIKK